MLLRACLIMNYKPPDVVVKKLCDLFMMSMCKFAYLEQLVNISTALLGLNMLHLGQHIIHKLLAIIAENATGVSRLFFSFTFTSTSACILEI